MQSAANLLRERVWVDKSEYSDAECAHYVRKTIEGQTLVERPPSNPQSLESSSQELRAKQAQTASKKSKEKKNKADKKNKLCKDVKKEEERQKEVKLQASRETPSPVTGSGSLAFEVAKARQHIKKGLQCVNNIASDVSGNVKGLPERVAALERDNLELHKMIDSLQGRLETLLSDSKPQPDKPKSCPPQQPKSGIAPQDDDDECDLFGSDSEGEDAEILKIREARLAAYNAKKSKKPVLIAKSNIILDVKPWDDETDMKALEAEVRNVNCDGLLWGASKLVPLAYGIHKLQISCVVEDEKVSVDWLTEALQEIEEYVQSVDIAAFNKV